MSSDAGKDLCGNLLDGNKRTYNIVHRLMARTHHSVIAAFIPVIQNWLTYQLEYGLSHEVTMRPILGGVKPLSQSLSI